MMGGLGGLAGGVPFLFLGLTGSLPPLSPLELHGRFLDLTTGGKPTRQLALRWRRQTGDRSFESFLADASQVRTALELERRALLAWDRAQSAEAVRLYRRAAKLLVGERALSEAAFCYYFIAELLAEEERFDLSTQSLRLALYLSGGGARPFLTGLILQSLAVNFWARGDLDRSLRALADAQFCWERIGFAPGQVAILYNLALLYEEMGVDSRASDCYEGALQRLDEDPELPEISFQVVAGLSRYLARVGERERAVRLFHAARGQPAAEPFELLLLEHFLAPGPLTRQALVQAVAPSRQAGVRRNLQLVRAAPESSKARRLLAEALELAEEGGAGRLQSEVATEFASWLEKRGEQEAAKSLYRRAIAGTAVASSDLLFPFSAPAARAREGLVRILLTEGRWRDARNRLHEDFSQLLEKTLAALFRLSEPPLGSGLGLLQEIAGKPEVWGRPRRFPARRRETIRLPEDALLIELWPDADRVYVWLQGSALEEEHLVLQLTESVSSLVGRVIDPLYRTEQKLRPAPDALAVRRLSRSLIGPLQPHLRRPRLLFVPHGELQWLPFEMLLTEEGNLLLDEFFISYLPPAWSPGPRAAGPPLAVVPVLAGGDPMMHRERFLFSVLFGESQVVLDLPFLAGKQADWIHVASHLRLDPDRWYRSTLSGGPREVDLWQLLRAPFRSRLLSLSTCDAGNARDSRTPFWMGTAGLFLETKSNALILNRWKLDQASVEIYLEFARRAFRGVSLDVALTLARREFKKKALRRGSARLGLEHPFFWAGVSYLGVPGTVLFEGCRPLGWESVMLPLLIPLCGFIRGLVRSRGRR